MSDSEDSDGEGGLGNVSRVIIRPPGTSGKAKRGHLCFDAAFETGNLGRADLVGEFEYDLFLRPDTCNPRYRFWFNFTVDNVKQDQRVIFNIVNISKTRNLFASGLLPIVKSTSRPKWQRLPKQNVFYYRSLVHQNHYVLSFTFAFDREDDVYQFTITPPYSYSRLQSYLTVIESRYHEKHFEKICLTKTLQNRNLELITIDHVPKSDKFNSKNPLRVIVVLARSHPAESPASFVCQGFIEFLIGQHPIANILRENFVFKIVPMVNPDGVFLGNNHCNLIGQDLNRTWHIATEFSHPTLYAIKNMLKEIDNSNNYQLDFVVDIHANTSLLGTFIYGNTYEDVYRYERHLVFPRLFATNTYDYLQANMMFNADDRKAGTARRFCCEHLSDTMNAYTLEISMYGYYLKDGKTTTPYTEDGYYRLGRNLARTFLQYYRFTNILPLPIVSELKPKRGRPKTHRPRGRSKIRPEIKPRPKTTRSYAPISYTDLSICRYESGTSDEGSPIRQQQPIYNSITASGSHHYCHRLRKQTAVIQHSIPDHFSLLSIKSLTKFDSYDISSVSDHSKKSNIKLPPLSEKIINYSRPNDISNIPNTTATTTATVTKPYLSIIDFNQLTRGSLEEATLKDKKYLKEKTKATY